MANDFTARVAGISVELGMSVQNKSGIWCKPTVKMDIKIDGGTNPQQREAIIKQAFDEVCDNIEKTISEIPVITAWVRDDNYVHSTKEIFLGEPSLEGFLHQFRHHLQNKAREPQYKYLLVENDPKADYRIPYKDCVYRMYGEDDARAWARMVIELAS